MDRAYHRLLSRQLGLITVDQAHALGIDNARIHRATAGDRPAWQRVLPRVYATFVHPLSPQQRTVAAWLYAGEGALLTAGAALHWHGVPYLPREVKPFPVDLLVPARRVCSPIQGARFQRTTRPPTGVLLNGIACAPVTRALVDCARTIRRVDPVIALVSSGLNSGRTSLEGLAGEVMAGPRRGSAAVRAALAELGSGARSLPEVELLRMAAECGLPQPAVNEPLLVDGQLLVPDVRWGWFIVEVDSMLHHLLRPGAFLSTEARRLVLQAATYHVLPVTPTAIREQRDKVRLALLDGYRRYAHR